MKLYSLKNSFLLVLVILLSLLGFEQRCETQNDVLTQSNLISYVLGATSCVGLYGILKNLNFKKEVTPIAARVAILTLENSIDKENAKLFIAKLKKVKNDPSISALIIKIDSPGGSLPPAEEIKTAIKKIEETKPVVIFVVEGCLSAAYFIASPFYIVAPQTSDVGSIGVYTVIKKEKSKEFNNGEFSGSVEFNAISSGKSKTTHHPNTPLTKEQIKEENNQVNALASIFRDAVIEDRGFRKDDIDENIFEGQSFVGKRALELRLINETGTFDDALEAAKRKLSETGILIDNVIEVEI